MAKKSYPTPLGLHNTTHCSLRYYLTVNFYVWLYFLLFYIISRSFANLYNYVCSFMLCLLIHLHNIICVECYAIYAEYCWTSWHTIFWTVLSAYFIATPRTVHECRWSFYSHVFMQFILLWLDCAISCASCKYTFYCLPFLSEENLEEKKTAEAESAFFTKPPHPHYMEMSKLLLQL